MFDYQSVRHCSKTVVTESLLFFGLITSQFDTAPKQGHRCRRRERSLITSQFDTAPKLGSDIPKGIPMFDYQSVRHCSKTTQKGQI